MHSTYLTWGLNPTISLAAPVTTGEQYRVYLLFSENEFKTANARLFHIDVEGTRIITDFTPIPTNAVWTTNPHTGVMVAYTFTAGDSTLDVLLTGKTSWGANNPVIQGFALQEINPPLSAPAGVKAYFSFDHSGNIGRDDSGNGYNGTLTDAVYSAAGRVNGGLALTTDNGRLTHASIPLGTNWTVSAWYEGLDMTSSRTMFRGTSYHHIMVQNGSNNLGLYRGGFRDGGQDLTREDGVWHMITAVGSPGQVDFYLDGQPYGSVSGYTVDPDVRCIGNYQGGGQRFADTIDEVYLYGRKLSATEVASLYNASLSCMPGLRAEFFDYTVALSNLPVLSGKIPEVTRTDAQINYPSVSGVAWSGLPTTMIDTFASRHTGVIRIETAGTYTFYLQSDDGSKLWIDGVERINNDGIHGMVELSAQVPLTAGDHTIRVEFFENTSGAGLIFSWAGPGIAKQVVPASALYQSGSSKPPAPGFTVTEYYLTTGNFTGTTATVTMNHNLANDYFILVRGSRDGDGLSFPDNDYARVVSVPGGKGSLSASGAANQIVLQRAVADLNWEGVVTVVECANPTSAAGFRLIDAVASSMTNTAGTNACATWDDLSRVVLFGGYRGGGVELLGNPTSRYQGVGAYTRLYPSGSGTINWQRDAGGETLYNAVMTTFVVQWGEEWTVQRVNVAGSNGGDGANATNEYKTAAIMPVSRDATWVWGSGTRIDAGIGDCAEACLVTLGNGVSQNATESTVAVGSEYTDAYNFELYAMSHPALKVDYRFKVDGDSTAADLAVAVDVSAAGARFAWVYNGVGGTGDYFPRPRMWARYTADGTVTISRGYSGLTFPAWIQAVDLSGLNQ